MNKEFNITVDIEKSIRNQVYNVNSNDLDTLKFIVTVNKSGAPISLTGITPRIAIKKPNRQVVFQDGTVTNAAMGQCEFLLTTQAYVVGGAHSAEIMLYEGTTKVAVSNDFTYTVAKGILNDDALESTNELQSINQALSDVEAVVTDLRENGTGIDAQARGDIETLNAEMAQKLNQGEVSVIDIDKNKGKFDQTYMTDEFLQQMAGSTPINAVPADGSLVTRKFADKAITVEKTNFIELSSNLLKEYNATVGYYLDGYGNPIANSSYSVTDYLPITPSTIYYFYGVYSVCFYDENKQFIFPRVSLNSEGQSYQTSENHYYMRVNFQPNIYTGSRRINKGDTLLSYETYYEKLKNVDVDELPNGIVTIATLEESLKTNMVNVTHYPSKNLFNKETITDKTYVDSSTGDILTHSSYVTSDFIPVNGGETYTRTTSSDGAGKTFHFYDENKLSLGFAPDNTLWTFTTPTDARYVIVTIRPNDVETYQLEKGSVATEYEPFIQFDSAVVSETVNNKNKPNGYVGLNPYGKIDNQFIDINDSGITFNDIEKVRAHGIDPLIVAYGDSNTEHTSTEDGIVVEEWESYIAHVLELSAFEPVLYDSQVIKEGFPGETAVDAINVSFQTSVLDQSPNFVVFGFGTNDIRGNVTLEDYLSAMEGMVVQSMDAGIIPIVLAIPWYENHTESKTHLWNTSLMDMCKKYLVPFIDTYSLTRYDGDKYMMERGQALGNGKRHYNHRASMNIASLIIEEIKKVTLQIGYGKGEIQDSWGLSNVDIFKNTSFTPTVNDFTMHSIGSSVDVLGVPIKKYFHTFDIPQGQSVTIQAKGRLCIAIYPDTTGTLDVTGDVVETVSYSADPLLIKKLTYGREDQLTEITLTATTGELKIRSVACEGFIVKS